MKNVKSKCKFTMNRSSFYLWSTHEDNFNILSDYVAITTLKKVNIKFKYKLH